MKNQKENIGMRKLKLVSIATMLVLAMMLTACNGTPSQGEVNNPSSSVKPSEPEKPDSQLPSQSEDPSEPESQIPSQSEDPSEPDDSLEDGWTRLTEGELKWFNEQFFNVAENRIVNAFLNCTYTDVKNIGLEELFYDVPMIDISDEEMSLLRGSKIDFDTDFQKVPVSYMDEILLTYANITLTDSNKVDLDMFFYIEKYDAYYSGHGDTHHSPVEVKSGAKDENGNLVLVCYRSEEEKNYQVTLIAHDNGYYFVSNVLAE